MTALIITALLGAALGAVLRNPVAALCSPHTGRHTAQALKEATA